MSGPVVPLESARPEAAGWRAGLFARLSAAGLPVPPGFVLGREEFERYAAEMQSGIRGGVPANLSRPTREAIVEALRALGGPVAVRRSPLELAAGSTPPVEADSGNAVRRVVGRPEREIFLHLAEPEDVLEAVRRLWMHALSPPAAPAAVLVQRFVTPEVSAILWRDRADAGVLHVEAVRGVGDLLHAGLVTPDHYTIRRRDGTVLGRRVAHKAYASMPCEDGGVRRVNLPPELAQAPALDDETLPGLAMLWRRVERAIGTVVTLSVAAANGELYVVDVAPAPAQGAPDDLLLG